MYKNANVYLENIDCDILRKQRDLLVEIEEHSGFSTEKIEKICGLINLCNAILYKVEGYSNE